MYRHCLLFLVYPNLNDIPLISVAQGSDITEKPSGLLLMLLNAGYLSFVTVMIRRPLMISECYSLYYHLLNCNTLSKGGITNGYYLLSSV